MTIAELERAFSSKRRINKQQAQQQASMDYILADLIGRSIGRIYSSSAKYPEIEKVYPSLFADQDIEDKRAQKKAELSALRFRKFADAFNKKFSGGVKKSE